MTELICIDYSIWLQIILSMFFGPFLYLKAFCQDIKVIFNEMDCLTTNDCAKNDHKLNAVVLKALKLHSRIIQ